MKTDAVIFDMGGVLIDLDLEACRKAFKEELGYMDIDSLIDASHQKGIWGDMEGGKISADEFRSEIMKSSREGVTPEDVDRAVAKILVGITPDKVELLKKIAGKYDLYMLSNNNPIATEAAERIFAAAGIDMEHDFRKCYLSFRMNMMKPSEAFYKAVMEDIGLSAEKMLFIDDSQKNVDAAVAAGLPAVYYRPGTDLAALLAKTLDDSTLLPEGGAVC